MCPVLTGRSRGPVKLGFVRGRKTVSGAFPGRLGGSVRITILCNSPLPAVFPRPWCEKKEAPLPARIQITRTCQTTQNPRRLIKKPTLKIGPIAAGRRRMNQALHSRVLKDSMVTLYSSASSFLIARRATASWFNLSKWSATLKAAPSQLAAAG